MHGFLCLLVCRCFSVFEGILAIPSGCLEPLFGHVDVAFDLLERCDQMWAVLAEMEGARHVYVRLVFGHALLCEHLFAG